MFSSFGALVQTLRTRRRLSQQALASALGVHRNTIGNWERGDKLPESKALVLELARALHLEEAETRQLLDASLTAPTLFWQVPYPRNPCFTGREAILQALHTRLAASRPVALTQSYALSGLGGVGKTHLALEYAYRHALEYHAVLWLAAESRESLLASMQQIADVLQLPEGKQADQERLVAAVQRWLTTHSHWLLIWDNVEDLELLGQFLPPVRQGAHLLTTRRAALGTLAEGWEVPLMSQEEGLVLVLRRAKVLGLADSTEQLPPIAAHHPGEYAAALDLVGLLEGLPLALDQAGAYAEETAGSLADYLRLYRTHRAELLSRRGDVTSAHPASVVTTWSLAFERLEQAHPAAADLLRLCALLAPDAIPEELFTAGAAHLGQRLGPVAADPLQWQAALRAVLAYSLLHRSSEDHTLSMHRLVQAVLRDYMEAPLVDQWMERIVCAVNAAFPDPEVATWSQCARLMPHAQVCQQWIEQAGIRNPEAGRLLHETGKYQLERGFYAEAESLLTRALAIRKQIEKPPYAHLAMTLDRLAWCYECQGKYEQAQPLYRQALALCEAHLGQDHPDTADVLNNLAGLYRKQGKYEQAKALLQRALTIGERQAHPEMATYLSNLARIARDQGKYPEAESLLLRVQALREQQFGPTHPRIATGLNNLATVYKDQGKYGQAEALLKRALTIFEQVVGPTHPHTAICLYNLAELARHQEHYAQAELLLRRVLAIEEQRLGVNHPSVATTLTSLANLSVEQGQYEQAKGLFERALHIREQQLGPHHPETAHTLHEFALLQQKQGHLNEAVSLAARALSIRSQSLGETHPHTVATQALSKELLQEQTPVRGKAAAARKRQAMPHPPRAEGPVEEASLTRPETVHPSFSVNHPLQQFLAACCELHPRAWCRSIDLWQAYEYWAKEHQEPYPLSRRAFTAQLTMAGCRADRTKMARIWRGIALVNMSSDAR